MWNFANRLPVSQSDVISTLENFLSFFSNQVRFPFLLTCVPCLFVCCVGKSAYTMFSLVSESKEHNTFGLFTKLEVKMVEY